MQKRVGEHTSLTVLHCTVRNYAVFQASCVLEEARVSYPSVSGWIGTGA